MSFGFSVGDFLAVLQLANKLRKQFLQAPEQFQAISNEVRSLSFVLQDAEIRNDSLSERQADRMRLAVGDCHALLSELETTLDRYSDLKKPTKGRTLKRFWKRFQFEPDDIRELRDRITLQISVLNTFETQIIASTIAELSTHQEDQTRAALLKWISPIDYIAQHRDFVNRQQPGSRKWLFTSPQYTRWIDEKGAILLCPGIPGAGKTITMAMITEALQTLVGNDADKRVVNVYCTYEERGQEIGELLHSFLRAALERARHIPPAISQLYNRYRTQCKPLEHDKVSELLRLSLSGLSRVYVLVDALDELPSHIRGSFIRELLQLHAECGVTLLLTTRDYPDVQRPFIKAGAASLEIRASDEDVRLYLSHHLSQLPDFVARDDALQKDIIDSIAEASAGMFLLAELHLKCLRGKTTPKKVRLALRHLATGSTAYDDAYEKAMGRIGSQSPDWKVIAMRALLIITCARRPLAVEELTYALSLDDESDAIDDDNVPDIKDVITACSGIITVDEEREVVRLVHKSTQEYLDRKRASLFPQANSTMAYLCIRYSSLVASIKGLHDSDPRSKALPFAEYAKANWGYHSLAAETERDGCRSEAASLGNDRGDIVSPPIFSSTDVPSTLGLIYMAKQLPDIESTIIGACRQRRHGMVEVLLRVYDVNRPPKGTGVAQMFNWHDNPGEYRLANDYNRHLDTSAFDVDDNVLLTIAAASGDYPMVKLLLDFGANVNIVGSRGKTALFIAAENNFEDVVSLLLDQETIEPDFRSVYVEDDTGGASLSALTAVSIAAKNGHSGCVKLLAEKSDLLLRDGKGRSALFFAAEGGHDQCIIELHKHLESAASHAEMDSPSPFLIALDRGHASAAELLVPPSDFHQCLEGERTAVRLAVDKGFYGILGQILQNGFDANHGPDNYTPLMAAIERQDIEATRALVASSDMTIRHGPTGFYAIHWAARYPDPTFAKVLLAKDGIEPDVLDKKGRSAFRLSAEYGLGELMEVLGKNKGVQVDRPCAKGLSAYDFMHQPVGWDGGVFRALLSVSPSFNFNALRSEGNAVLHEACRTLPEITRRWVRDLGSYSDVWSLKCQDVDLTRLINALLDHPTIDVNLRTATGNTPLHLAVLSCQVDTIRALLQHKDILPNIGCEAGDGNAPLLVASCCPEITDYVFPWPKAEIVHDNSISDINEKYHGFQNEILDLLLDCPEVSTFQTNSMGWTALHMAAACGNGYMIRSILDKTSLSSQLDKLLPDGRSVFSLAMTNRNLEKDTVKWLLGRTPVAMLHLPDRAGRTPLSYAAENIKLQMVCMLLELPNIEVNVPDDRGNTPMYYLACKRWEDYHTVAERYRDLHEDTGGFERWMRDEIVPRLLQRKGDAPIFDPHDKVSRFLDRYR